MNNVLNVDTDYNTYDFELPRNNKDNTVHISYGKCLVELCCAHDIHLLNGRLHDDFSGSFTCTANNGKSVVEYFIASSKMFPFITYFTVVDRDESDHFPIQSGLSFNLQRVITQIHCETERAELFPLDRFKWKNDLCEQFLFSFDNNFFFKLFK